MALVNKLEKQGNWLFKYRGSLPLIVLLIGLSVYIVSLLSLPNASYSSSHFSGIADFVYLAISLFGLLIRIFTVGYTPKWTSGRNTAHQVAEQLNTTGMYSIVRHPLYLGNFFMWLGVMLLTGNIWFIVAVVLFYFLYYERIMFAEEQFLIKKFGTAYLNWSAKTPAIIPNLKLWEHSDLEFSWKKVLRQEKNGLVAIFILFLLFKVMGNFILHKPLLQGNMFWLIATAVSTVVYFILKFLKYNTNLLQNER